jgi:hypothetical protein
MPFPVPVIGVIGSPSSAGGGAIGLGGCVGVVSGGPIVEWQWQATASPRSMADFAGVNGAFAGGSSGSSNPYFFATFSGVYSFAVRARNAENWSAPVTLSFSLSATESRASTEIQDASQAQDIASDLDQDARIATVNATAVGASLAAANAQATANSANLKATQALTSTPRPSLDYTSVTVITANLPDGYAMARFTFQDGLSRSFTVAPTFNPSLGAVEGGLDVGAEQASKWYYLYLVPTVANDALLCVRGSLNNPSVGPNGYTNFKYIGAVYNDAGSNLLGFHHDRSRRFYLETLNLVYNAGPVGPDVLRVTNDLSAFIPWTASAAFLYADLEGPAGGTTLEWHFYMHAAGGDYVHMEVRGSSTLCIFPFVMPIHVIQTTYRQLLRPAGGGNATLSYGVNGWEDGWLN